MPSTPALYWSEIEELRAKARRIMECYPSRFGQGQSSDRLHQLKALADDYGINVRTVYRYLRMGEPRTVRVGPWSARFASRPDGPPSRVGAWVRRGHRAPNARRVQP